MLKTNISKEELNRRKSQLENIVRDIEKYMAMYGEELPNEVQVKGAEPILRRMGEYLASGHGPGCTCPAFAEILVKKGSTPTETLRYGVARDGSVLTVTVDVARRFMTEPTFITLLKCEEHNVTVRELMTGLHNLIDDTLTLSSATQPAARA